jgi:hypothetical protein
VMTPYEREIRRATARALVERVMWLAGGAPMPQVRAIASRKLNRMQSFPSPTTADRDDVGDQAMTSLLAADIKRFLERPMEATRTPTTFDAPPGAPIGDEPMDWLASPPWWIRDRRP